MADDTIKVLLADGAAASRDFLVHLLESDPRLRVVAAVSNGQAALDFSVKHHADVVVIDVNLSKLDAFELTRRIMTSKPVPIIICVTTNSPDANVAFRAMEAGAISCVEKPVGQAHGDFAAVAVHFLQTVRLMAAVKVVRRTTTTTTTTTLPAVTAIKVIGVAASTGGPLVLQTILAGLPKDFPVPVLVVQHIACGFVTQMAEWLNQTSGLQVCIAAHELRPQPGYAYLAPDGFHMGVGVHGEIILSRQPPENGLRPAAGFLFRSLAAVHGANAWGILLTGMGKDGAVELKAMKDRRAITIAQDEESSVVHGMPGTAIALGGATHVLAPAEIVNTLRTLMYDGVNVSRSSDDALQ